MFTTKLELLFLGPLEWEIMKLLLIFESLIKLKIRNALIFWLIVDELPFRTIDVPCFKFFMSVACYLATTYDS